MKRRRMSSTSDRRNPRRFHPRAETSGGFRGGRSSDGQFGAAACLGEPAEQPKTAEYAFFQKLKEARARGFPSHPLDVEKNKSETFESRGDRGSGAQCTLDVFSRKRENLLQWLRSTLSPEINELRSKRFDFLSLLLSRLFGTGDEDKISKTLNMDQTEADGTHGKAVDFHLDANIKEFYQKPKELVEVGFESFRGCGSSSSWPRKSGERIFSVYSTPSAYGFVPWSETREMDCISLGNIGDQIRAIDMKWKAVNFHPDIKIKEFYQEPKVLVEVGVETFRGYGSSSAGPSKSGERILSVYDSPSAYGFDPWSETREVDYMSWENIRDIAPYATSDSALDFPHRVGSTVSCNFLRNVDFPHANSNGPFLRGQSHTPLLPWNSDKDERDWLTTCAREEVTNDHSLSLNFQDIDHHHSIMGGYSGKNTFPALPPNDGSSTETCFHAGFKEDSAAFLKHTPITLSYFPSRFHLPEEWIHDLLLEVFSHQKTDEYKDDIFTERHNHQSGMISSAPHSVFGSDLGWKSLLPWDSSGEAQLIFDQALLFHQEENVISSSFYRKAGWEDFMEDTYRINSSGCPSQSIDLPYLNF
ncbi:hypothetical protein CDL15_Pgr009980 [Punica granatum]|uniref:Uncharacterized protein n=1 Tax=Punica granatum TaxID=22663 RepID=A0A218X6K6_PUNGR|nr:hypothetical protein CDL15_Pgr009980 [Punica granatum]